MAYPGWIDGFEHYTAAQLTTLVYSRAPSENEFVPWHCHRVHKWGFYQGMDVNGTVTAITASMGTPGAGGVGGYLRLTGSSSYVSHFDYSLTYAVPQVGFWFKLSETPADVVRLLTAYNFWDSTMWDPSIRFTIDVQPDGRVLINGDYVGSSYTSEIVSTNAYSSLTEWNWLEVRIGLATWGAEIGSCRIRMNTTDDTYVPNVNMNLDPNAELCLTENGRSCPRNVYADLFVLGGDQWHPCPTHDIGVSYSHFYINDQQSEQGETPDPLYNLPDGFIGPCHVRTLFPAGDGAHTTFGGAGGWQALDDNPADDASTSIPAGPASPTAFVLPDWATVTMRPILFQTNATMLMTGGADPAPKAGPYNTASGLFWTDDVDWNLTWQGLSTDWETFSWKNIFLVYNDSGASAPLRDRSASFLNALQYGFGASSSAEMTQLAVEVLMAPIAGGGRPWLWLLG